MIKEKAQDDNNATSPCFGQVKKSYSLDVITLEKADKESKEEEENVEYSTRSAFISGAHEEEESIRLPSTIGDSVRKRLSIHQERIRDEE